MPSAIAVIALAERGTMFDPGPIVYMEKMAVGDRFADLLDLDRPLGETVELIAERKGTDVNDVMAVVLDRPRHAEGIDAIRKAGGRVQLITDGDVSGALNAVVARPRGRLPVGHRRHAGGRDHRRGGQVHRRRARRPAARRATTPSARPRSTPATTSTACSRTTTSCAATTCSSPPPA